MCSQKFLHENSVVFINIASIYMLIVALSHSHDILWWWEASRQKHSRTEMPSLDTTIIYIGRTIKIPENERRLRV